MSSRDNALLALDAITALIEIQANYAAVYNRAKAEGRDISNEELDQLTADNRAKRSAWDAAK
jgi:hypothetical protein